MPLKSLHSYGFKTKNKKQRDTQKMDPLDDGSKGAGQTTIVGTVVGQSLLPQERKAFEHTKKNQNGCYALEQF